MNATQTKSTGTRLTLWDAIPDAASGLSITAWRIALLSGLKISRVRTSLAGLIASGDVKRIRHGMQRGNQVTYRKAK